MDTNLEFVRRYLIGGLKPLDNLREEEHYMQGYRSALRNVLSVVDSLQKNNFLVMTEKELIAELEKLSA